MSNAAPERRRVGEVVVDVAADERRVGDAGFLRELRRERDGSVADVDAGDLTAPRFAMLSESWPQLHWRCTTSSAAHVAEQLALLRVELAPAAAEERRLLALVAVVRVGGGVPGKAVVLVKLGDV